MKIRSSLLAPLMPLLVLLPGVPLFMLLKPEAVHSAEAQMTGALAGGALVVFLYLFAFCVPRAEIRRDGYRVNGRGWSPWKMLGHGERFVIYRNRIRIQRIGGTLESTTIAKWSTARRQWRRLELWFPTVDDPSRR